MIGIALVCAVYSVLLAVMHWYEWSALVSPDKRISTGLFALVGSAFAAVAWRMRRHAPSMPVSALLVTSALVTVATLPGRVLLIRNFRGAFGSPEERATHNALRLLISAQEDARISSGQYAPTFAALTSPVLREVPSTVQLAVTRSDGADRWSGESIDNEAGWRCAVDIDTHEPVASKKNFLNDDVRCSRLKSPGLRRANVQQSAIARAKPSLGASPFDSLASPREWLVERATPDQNGVVASALPPVSWTTHIGHEIRAGATIVGNRVLVGGHGTGWLGALDAQTGAILWSTRVPSWVHQDPVVSRGSVIVGVGDKDHLAPTGTMGLGIGGAASYDLNDGRLRWFTRVTGGVMEAPAIWNDLVIVPDGSGTIQALRFVDGSRVWSARMPGNSVMASPLFDDSTVFVAGTPRFVCAYAAATGHERWCFNAPYTFTIGGDATASLIHGTIYWSPARATTGIGVFSGGAKAAVQYLRERLSGRSTTQSVQWLIAIDAKTGHERWRQELGGGFLPKGNISGTAVPFWDKIILIAPLARTMFALDTATGRIIWRRPSDSFARGAVTIVDSTIISTDEAGHLHLLRAEDGSDVCQGTLPDVTDRAGPIVAGANVIFTGLKGTVFVRPLANVLRCDTSE